MTVLCIYPPDEFVAAWAVRHALGDGVEFVAAPKHDEPFPWWPVPEGQTSAITGRDILILDDLYPLPDLRAMAAEAKRLVLIGKDAGGWLRVRQFADDYFNVLLDHGKSISGLAWDYLHPGQPRPRIIDLDEDYVNAHRLHSSGDIHGGGSDGLGNRDLPRLSEEAAAFHAVLRSYDERDLPRMFRWLDAWDEQFRLSLSEELPAYRVAGLFESGRAILRAQAQDLRRKETL